MSRFIVCPRKFVVLQQILAREAFDHRYPKLYGRLDRVNFDRHVTAKL